MSVTELKSLAYDQLVQIETSQKNIQAINQEIAKRPASPVPAKKEEPKKDK